MQVDDELVELVAKAMALKNRAWSSDESVDYVWERIDEGHQEHYEEPYGRDDYRDMARAAIEILMKMVRTQVADAG